MINKKKHSCCKYALHQEIIHKLSKRQVFWLCVLALLILGLIGTNIPATMLELI